MSAAAETLNPIAVAVAPMMAAPLAGEAGFKLAQRQAQALSASALVPPSYRGNLPNCLIAMELAGRIGASPFAVMQNLHIVQGRPSWSASFLIATVNACGRFEPLRFEVVGSDPFAKDYRVRAYAKDKASGEICYGAWITWKMVEAEGWASKTGSKWKTMPEQMFMYRAAGFWSRVYAPEISLGMQTTEEAQDVWGGNAELVTAPANTGTSVTDLEQHLLGADVAADGDPPTDVDPDTGEVREG